MYIEMALQEIKNIPPQIFSMKPKIPIPWVYEDSISYTILDPSSEFMKKINTLCPTQCYTIEQDKVTLQHEGRIEGGSCFNETDWKHPPR